MHDTLARFALILFIGIVAQADEHGFAKDGKSRFVIATPAKPMPEEVMAANWLATTLKQVIEADFAINTEDTKDLPDNNVVGR